MRLNLIYGVGEWARGMETIKVPVSDAAFAAIQEVAEDIKRDARAHIAGAGFSTKWQNAMRVNVYPPGKTKVAGELAAAWVYHAIPYAGVFERGATVRAKMWVPLPWAPKRMGRMRASPGAFVAAYNQPLFPLRTGSKFYLAASVVVAGKKARQFGPVGVSASALRRGRTGKGEGHVQLVPLFVSVSSVKFKDRLNIQQVVEKAANGLAEAFFKHSQGA